MSYLYVLILTHCMRVHVVEARSREAMRRMTVRLHTTRVVTRIEY